MKLGSVRTAPSSRRTVTSSRSATPRCAGPGAGRRHHASGAGKIPAGDARLRHEVRLGCTFTEISQTDEHVAVGFSDGSRYL